MSLPREVVDFEVLPYLSFLDVYRFRRTNSRFFRRYLDLLPEFNLDLSIYHFAIDTHSLDLLADLLLSGGYEKFSNSEMGRLVNYAIDGDASCGRGEVKVIFNIRSLKYGVKSWTSTTIGMRAAALDDELFKIFSQNTLSGENISDLIDIYPRESLLLLGRWLDIDPSISFVQRLLHSKHNIEIFLQENGREDLIERISKIIRNGGHDANSEYLECLLSFEYNVEYSSRDEIRIMVDRNLTYQPSIYFKLRTMIRYPDLWERILSLLSQEKIRNLAHGFINIARRYSRDYPEVAPIIREFQFGDDLITKIIIGTYTMRMSADEYRIITNLTLDQAKDRGEIKRILQKEKIALPTETLIQRLIGAFKR